MSAAEDAVAFDAPRPARERLVTTLIFALLAHGVVLLGVGFVALAPRQAGGSRVNVMLASPEHAGKPADAAYLARINQRGFGNTRHHLAVERPATARNRFPNPGFALARDFATRLANPLIEAPRAAPVKPPGEAIVTTRSRSSRAVGGPRRAAGNAEPVLRARLEMPAARPGIQRTAGVKLPRLYGPHPKAKARAANARAALAAPYLLAWQRRIERIGSARFKTLVPARVRRGHLALAVTLAADGSVQTVAIVKRSSHAALDAAALKIIRLGAPFAPFPPALRARAATLTFTYRWNFFRGAAGRGSVGLGGG